MTKDQKDQQSVVLSPKYFNMYSAEDAGGQTGSKSVEDLDKNMWQYKFDIRNQSNIGHALLGIGVKETRNRYKRAKKSGHKNVENFGEVIAATVTSALSTDNWLIVPEVKLVYDEEKKRTNIASKYVENCTGTLDNFIVNKTSNTSSKIVLVGKKHVKFVRTPPKANHKNREYDFNKLPESMRKDIARGVAASMLVGDHDVNPGNFVVVEEESKEPRCARIDFGHAFNDLIKHKNFGGGKEFSNSALDFLNRNTVAKVNFGKREQGDIPKLWRDYPGLVPSRELADALLEISVIEKVTGITSGMNNSLEHFQKLLKMMQHKNDKDGIKNLLSTVAEMVNSMTGLEYKIESKKTHEVMLAEMFENIKLSIVRHHKDIQHVAKVMELQVNIDERIKEILESPEVKSVPDELENLASKYKSKYDSLKSGGEAGKGIQWIKTSADGEVSARNLSEYITMRAVEMINIENAKVQEDSQSRELLREGSKGRLGALKRKIENRGRKSNSQAPELKTPGARK